MRIAHLVDLGPVCAKLQAVSDTNQREVQHDAWGTPRPDGHDSLGSPGW